MKNTHQILLAAVFIMLQIGHLRAEVNAPKFRISVDRNEIQRDEDLQMSINISLNQAHYTKLQLPRTHGFRILRREQKRHRELIYLSGERTSIRYHWVITLTWRSIRTGRFRFSEGLLWAGGRRYTASSIDVEVRDKIPDATLPDLDLPRQINAKGDIFILPLISPDKVFVGQQATLSYYLFTRYSETISTPSLPLLDYFWIEPLNPLHTLSFSNSMNIDGRRYKYDLALRYAIFPKRTGKLQISPLSFQVHHIGRDATQTSQITSPSVFLQALPIPQANRPSHFAGQHQIGRFKLTASISQQNMPLDIPMKIEICGKGIGYIRQIALPDFEPQSDLILLSKRREISINPIRSQVRGKICHILYYRAKKPGKYRLPSLSLHYFDPWLKQFSIAQSNILEFAVLPATNTHLDKIETQAKQGNAKHPKTDEHPRPPQPQTKLPPDHNAINPFYKLIKTIPIWIVPTLIGILLALIWLISRQRKNSHTHADTHKNATSAKMPKHKSALYHKDKHTNQENYIALIQDFIQFLEQTANSFEDQQIEILENFIYRILNIRSQKLTSETTFTELFEQFKISGVYSEIYSLLRQIIDLSHNIRYSPTKQLQDIDKLQILCRKLQKQLPLFINDLPQ